MAERVWLITGASRGFGAEISQAVLAAGDKLVATARTMRGLEHLGTHGNLFTAGLDVTDEPQVRDAVQAALAHVGHVDILLHLELAPLGIHATVVEPGFFRTDVLDPSRSLIATAGRITDYADTAAGAMREAVPGYNHQQPGDPAKLAHALLELVNAADPPLRLPLGPDTLTRMAEKNAVIERETSTWRALAASTDY